VGEAHGFDNVVLSVWEAAWCDQDLNAASIDKNNLA